MYIQIIKYRFDNLKNIYLQAWPHRDVFSTQGPGTVQASITSVLEEFESVEKHWGSAALLVDSTPVITGFAWSLHAA